MTSSKGHIFRLTGPLWGELTGHRLIPLTKASDAGLEILSVPEHTVEQTIEAPLIWDAITLIKTSLWYVYNKYDLISISISNEIVHQLKLLLITQNKPSPSCLDFCFMYTMCSWPMGWLIHILVKLVIWVLDNYLLHTEHYAFMIFDSSMLIKKDIIYYFASNDLEYTFAGHKLVKSVEPILRPSALQKWRVHTHCCRCPRWFPQFFRRPMSARPVEVSRLHSSSHCRSVLGCDSQDRGFWRRYIWVSLVEIEMSTLKWQVIHCTPDISLTLSPRNAQQTPHRYPMVVFIASSKSYWTQTYEHWSQDISLYM